MKPIGRYLVGAFAAAALYYAISRVLWTSDRSPVAAILPAVAFGLIVEALYTQRVRSTNHRAEPYPPTFYSLAGLSGLAASFAFRAGVTPGPTGLELFGLLGGIALSLYLLGCGFTMAWRRSAQRVGSDDLRT